MQSENMKCKVRDKLALQRLMKITNLYEDLKLNNVKDEQYKMNILQRKSSSTGIQRNLI